VKNTALTNLNNANDELTLANNTVSAIATAVDLAQDAFDSLLVAITAVADADDSVSAQLTHEVLTPIVQVTPQSSGVVVLNVTPPVGEQGNTWFYQVVTDDPDAANPYENQTLNTDGAPETFTIEGLTPGATYTVRVANWNGTVGGYSETIISIPVTQGANLNGGGPVTTTPIDTTPVDTTPIDTTPVDTEPVDTTPVDTEPVDTTPVDTEPIDTEPVDTEPIDTNPVDTEPIDTEPVDTPAEEAEAVFEESEASIEEISESGANLSVVEVQEIITDLISDSGLDVAEISAVLEAIAEGGEVSAEVAAEVSESLSEGGLTEAEAEFIVEMLSADGEITTAEVVNLSDALTEDGTFTLAEKDLVSDVLVESAEGAPVTAANIEAAGLEYRDLPPAIPVEVREDINGYPVVITAEVASALLTLESPAALVGAITGCFNPEEAIEGLTEEQKCEVFKALANIGADMSEPERQKATEVLVAAVLVGQIILGSSILRIRG
jgi:hypothetical protein